MQLLALPAFADNYIWLLHDSDGQALVVDPGDAAVVEAALERHGLALRAILVTHHHADHIGGLAALRLRHDAVVYGPDDDRVEADRIVGQGDVVTLDRPCARFEVLEVPGHTRSHIAFVGAGLLFCGDTLFSLGCGRLFEGTAAQMLASLDRLAALPGHLQVCCAHEYTVANGRFAHEVDPANQALTARCEAAGKARSEGLPTLPVALSSELACNPFLRIDSEALVAWGRHHGASDRTARFAALRAAKDAFR